MDIRLNPQFRPAQPALPLVGGVGLMVNSFGGHRIRFDKPNEGVPGGDPAPEPTTGGDPDPEPAPEPKPEAKPESAKPSDEVAKLLKDVMKHKEKAKAAEGQATQAESALTALREQIRSVLGVEDISEIDEKLKKLSEDEEAKLRASGDFDKLKDRIVSEHKKELNRITGETSQKVGDLTARLEAAEGEIRRLLVSNSFAASKYLSDELTLAPSHAERLFGESFKVEAKDGRRGVVAYRADGTPITDSEGNPLPFDLALKELVNADPAKDALLKPKAKQGAGSGVIGAKNDVPQPDTKRGVSRIAAGLAAQR